MLDFPSSPVVNQVFQSWKFDGTKWMSIATGAVTSFNTRTGAVTLAQADVTGVGGALLVSPGFSGVPTAPTASPGTSTTQLATTAFVASNAVTSFNTRSGAVTLQASDVTGVNGALLASPTFTGAPSMPTGSIGVTQAANNNSTALATTAYVDRGLAGPLAWGAMPSTEVQNLPIAFCFPGKPLGGALIGVPIVMSLTIAASLTGSKGNIGTAATAAQSFTLYKWAGGFSGTQSTIGTISFAIAPASTATFSGSGGNLSAGDVLQIAAPATQDSTMADIGITIMAKRV